MTKVTKKETGAQVRIEETAIPRPETSKEEATMTKKTLKELRAEAKERGCVGYYNMRKAELEAWLYDSEEMRLAQEEAERELEEQERQKKEKRRAKEIQARKRAVKRCKTAEEIADHFSCWKYEMVIAVTRELLPEMPEIKCGMKRGAELRMYAEQIMKLRAEQDTKGVSHEDQMPKVEIAPETSEKKPEEVSVMDELSTASGDRIKELAEELYGPDYVRTMLMKLLKAKTEEKKNRPVTRKEMKKAFDELEMGKTFVNIPELRKALNWGHDEFDNMLRELRDEGSVQLVKTDLTRFEPQDFFYDEENARRGMMMWLDGELSA